MEKESSNAKVDLGFINNDQIQNSKILKCKYFVSKVGGKPLWLSFSNLLSSNQLTCQFCDHVLIFLLQIYAPVCDNPDAFHRTLFVWACVNPKCFKGFKVFRSQLKRDNPFYNYNPPNYDNEDDNSYDPKPQDFNLNTCKVCGIFSNQCCSKCKLAFYCGKEHQTFDWKEGKHKYVCKESNEDACLEIKSKPLLFPEYELLIDPEDQDNNDDSEAEEDNDKNEQKQQSFKWYLEKYKPQLQEENLDCYFDENAKDKTFNNFKKAIKGYEDQVIRYYLPDSVKNPEPLWISDQCKPNCIPVCQNCKSNRTLEFQIMPQLINYLNSNIDFGTLVVYTCSQRCTSEKTAYLEEFIWPQYI
jgi:hypothetical protein